MKHRTLHSSDLPERFPALANELGVTAPELEAAYAWCLEHNVLFEDGDGEKKQYYLASLDLKERIENPLGRRLFCRLSEDLHTRLMPVYGKNWPTLRDRWLRVWEQSYNILINKIPSHHVRLAWLRLGGAKIGKGSSIWRNTEILGVENLVMGEDSVISWHCVVDARAGLVIGDHVAIASHVLLIAGTHDLAAPEFWSISGPIVIDDYAWIASRSLIAHSTHIGRGAVVTANTVVAKNVAPYKIVGGSGAKPMGERPHNLNYKVGGKSLFTLLH